MANRYFVGSGTVNWNSTTNWSASDGGASGASFPIAGDSVFLTAASGANTLIVNVTSACLLLNCTGFTGELTFSATLVVSGSITFNPAMTLSGTFNLNCNATATLTSGGLSFPGTLALYGTSTITLADAWTVNSLVIGSSTSGGTLTTTVNAFSITVNVNFVNGHTAAGIAGGTTEVIMVGTGNIGASSTTTVTQTNLTINTTGTITITATTFRYNLRTLKYIAGTVVTTGTTLICGSSTLLNVDGIVWENVVFNGVSTITLQSNIIVTGTFTLGSTTSNITINGVGFQIVTSGPVSCPLTTGLCSGTATLKFTATQTATHTTGTSVINIKILIDAPGGTVTFVGDWFIKLTTMRCLAGTVITPKGTWTAFGGSTPVQKSFASIG